MRDKESIEVGEVTVSRTLGGSLMSYERFLEWEGVDFLLFIITADKTRPMGHTICSHNTRYCKSEYRTQNSFKAHPPRPCGQMHANEGRRLPYND